jgi:UDP-N-acetyl-D-glucosamine dehydrogenase
VSESTSYPGTLREIIIPLVESLKPKDSRTLYFASAPERVNPADPIWNQKNTPRLVGAINEASLIKASSFYKSICDDAVLVSRPEIAEAAKLLENTFRLVNIALINEFTQMCSSDGIDVNEVIDAAATKPYGFMPFRPGVGVGGHCIPVDPIYLSWWAKKLGCEAKIIETADSINNQMSEFVSNRILRMINLGKKNPKILILGIQFKNFF